MLDDLLGDAGEDGGVVGGELGEDLAVKLEAGFLKLINESRVGLVAVLTDGGVQPNYPELAEVRLLIATVGEGIATRAHQRFVCEVQLLRAETAVALRSLQDILLALECVDASFNSCHSKLITSRP